MCASYWSVFWWDASLYIKHFFRRTQSVPNVLSFAGAFLGVIIPESPGVLPRGPGGSTMLYINESHLTLERETKKIAFTLKSCLANRCKWVQLGDIRIRLNSWSESLTSFGKAIHVSKPRNTFLSFC